MEQEISNNSEPQKPKVYEIPPERMSEMQERLAKLNKRAVKLGTSPISFIGTDDQIKAGDDLADTAWFGLDNIFNDKIHLEGEHQHLYEALVKYETETK